MRELKFRAWDKLAKRFIYPDRGYRGHYILDLNGSFYDLHNGSGGDEYVVQQYTGLQDKHGKDIYEGDIVSGVCLFDGPQICVVGFDTFGIFYTKIKFYPCEEWDNVAMLAQEHNEVIGNIFENSELLIKKL